MDVNQIEITSYSQLQHVPISPPPTVYLLLIGCFGLLKWKTYPAILLLTFDSES